MPKPAPSQRRVASRVRRHHEQEEIATLEQRLKDVCAMIMRNRWGRCEGKVRAKNCSHLFYWHQHVHTNFPWIIYIWYARQSKTCVFRLCSNLPPSKSFRICPYLRKPLRVWRETILILPSTIVCSHNSLYPLPFSLSVCLSLPISISYFLTSFIIFLWIIVTRADGVWVCNSNQYSTRIPTS